MCGPGRGGSGAIWVQISRAARRPPGAEHQRDAQQVLLLPLLPPEDQLPPLPPLGLLPLPLLLQAGAPVSSKYTLARRSQIAVKQCSM